MADDDDYTNFHSLFSQSLRSYSLDLSRKTDEGMVMTHDSLNSQCVTQWKVGADIERGNSHGDLKLNGQRRDALLQLLLLFRPGNLTLSLQVVKIQFANLQQLLLP